MHPRLEQAVRKLSENPKTRITLPRLADEVCLSPRHLEFLFKTRTGMALEAAKRHNQPFRHIATALSGRRSHVLA